VIERRLALLQVGDEQVANRAACDCVPIDQLGRAELADSAEGPDRRRRLGRTRHGVEQLVKAHALVRTQRLAVDDKRECRQSPTLSHATFHPLWQGSWPRDAVPRLIVRPAGEASQSATSSEKPSGSRSFAMFGTRFCGARGLSTQSRLGRITSVQTSMSAQTRRLLERVTPQ